MVRAGQLREQVSIRRGTVTTGATGQDKIGAPYTTVATVWARIETKASTEKQAKSMSYLDNEYTVTLRYYDVQATDQIVWGATVLNVLGIVHDEKHTQTTLTAKED